MTFERSTFVRTAPLLLVTSGAFVTMLLFRRWFNANRNANKAAPCTCKSSLDSKVVVITGATSGIGYQVALECAKRGASVIFGARDASKGESVAVELRSKSNNQNVVALRLDLNSFKSCKEFAVAVMSRETEIAFLVNNAGIFNKAPAFTEDGFEHTWQTNYLGCVVVTENLMDCIGMGVEGNKGIIFLSSAARKMVKPQDIMDIDQMRCVSRFTTMDDGITHYAKTKKALWIYATFLAYSQGGSTLSYSIVSVDPGNVWTNIYRDSFRGSVSGLLTRWQCSWFMRTPLEGAQTVLHCMLAPDVTNGACLKDCCVDEVPCKDTVECGPSFVARTHKLLMPHIPSQGQQEGGGTPDSAGIRRRMRPHFDLQEEGIARM